jgi:hypothetical protein
LQDLVVIQWLIMKIEIMDNQIDQIQQQDPNGYNPHPFKHMLGMGLGAGTAYYGYSRGRKAIAPKDYSAYKKEYKAIKALKPTDPTAYETKMNAFKQKPDYNKFKTAGRFKLLGRFRGPLHHTSRNQAYMQSRGIQGRRMRRNWWQSW